ncbi:MAG: glutamate-5-semialdehyde dehydrogenase, partial [Evtepia sp.]|nr:glutamate-5-semialdehyde dehydrogenase [Evtepia sp.]
MIESNLTTQDLLINAQTAKPILSELTPSQKADVLRSMADCLLTHTQSILEQNRQDVEAATGHISPVMIDRLQLTEGRIADMATGIKAVADLPDPTGLIRSSHTLPNGLVVEKTSVPLGVIAIIYESRPNVTSDAASLAFKSGNVCVLRGGKESFRSNCAIVDALHDGLRRHNLPEALISLVQDTTRASAKELMTAVGLVDLLIPRGGAALIQTCIEEAKVPCIQTGTGICHIYVDASADPEKALRILENAKTSRPSVCNAMEVCLVNEAIAPT